MARRWELSLSTALRLAPRQALLVLPSHDSVVPVDRHPDRHLAIAGLGEARFLALGAAAAVSALGPASLPGRKVDRGAAASARRLGRAHWRQRLARWHWGRRHGPSGKV